MKKIVLNARMKKILIAVAVLGIAVYLIGCKIVATIVYADYATEMQIATIAENLGFDTVDATHIDGKNCQFIHNNGKPIQVVIDDELKEYEPQITKALDNIVGLIHSVNDKYSYEIVDRYRKTRGKSVIIFESKDGLSSNLSLIGGVWSPHLLVLITDTAATATCFSATATPEV